MYKNIHKMFEQFTLLGILRKMYLLDFCNNKYKAIFKCNLYQQQPIVSYSTNMLYSIRFYFQLKIKIFLF